MTNSGLKIVVNGQCGQCEGTLAGWGLAFVISFCIANRRSFRSKTERPEEELARRLSQPIQSVETSIYESMELLAAEVADYNQDELQGYSGAVFVTDLFYPFELSGVARERGIGSRVVVRQAEGSPADEAGLMLGDQLLRLNGKQYPEESRERVSLSGSSKALARDQLTPWWLIGMAVRLLWNRSQKLRLL